MRNIFIEQAIAHAEQDENMYLLTADLGFRALESFRDRFPDRFVNVGAAESNMIGLAAGMAMMGKRVCVYSIVPFVTLRCFEQIRNDICAHRFPVTLVGIGGGFNYGNQGISHNTTEDVAVMRALPNMSVFCPGDAKQAESMSDIALVHRGPSYIRLGRADLGIPLLDSEYAYGRGATVKNGSDVTILFSGNIYDVVAEVVTALEERGIGVRVISMPCIKPLDEEMIVRAAKETKGVFVIEEHSVIGGLGSAVAEVIAEADCPKVPFKRFGVPDCFPDRIGDQKFLRSICGLTSSEILQSIHSLIRL